MKLTCKYHKSSHTLTLYFPAKFDTSILADSSVTTDILANDSVTTLKIVDAAIESVKLATASITGEKVATTAIGSSHLQDALITVGKIANLAVSTDKLADLTITAGKLATGAVTEAKLGASSVTATKIANLAVGSAKIADAAIIEAKIGAAAVGAAAIANLAVGSAKIADAAIIEAKIDNAAVTEAKIHSAAVVSAKIADLAVIEAKIGNLAVNDAKIASVNANKIVADSLSVISANLGAITAGTITMPTTGWIKGGQTAYATGTGFFLGYSGTAYKFSFGSSIDYIKWNGSVLTLSDGLVTQDALIAFTAGNLLEASSDGGTSTASASYTKVKEIYIARKGTLRIKFDLWKGSAATAYGRIYKNGVAVGTARSNSSTTPVTYTQDIAGWSAGDLVQIYAHGDGSLTAQVRFFRLYSNQPLVSVATL